MKKLAVLSLVVASACVSGCSGGGGDTATATPAPYENGFENATDWLFYNPDDATTPPSPTVATLWAFDGSPADMPGGSFVSPTNSLNYNNGTDYDAGSTRGVAISPKIDIAGMTAPILVFKCNYETEDSGTIYDQRHVKVGYLDANLNPVYHIEEQLSTTPGAPSAGACAAMGTWHEHIIALDPSWGQIRAAFGFDTVDGAANTYKGWFVEDFAIIEASAYVPWGGGPTGGGGGGGTGGSVTGTYATNFEGGVTGWVMGGSGVAWGVDGSPVTMTGGSAYSGTTSLNYNNGVSYDDGLPNSGTATTPLVDTAGITGAVLQFACNYATETAGTGFDQRFVRVVSAGGTVVYLGQLAESGGSPELGPCSASGTWHQHTLPIDPSWGPVKVDFVFDTVDDVDNGHPGWFIDDLVIGDVAATGGTGGTGGGSGGGGFGAPAVDTHDGRNGGKGLNDKACSWGAVAVGGSGLWLLAIAAALAIIALGARR